MDIDDCQPYKIKNKEKRRSGRGRRSSVTIAHDPNLTPIETDVPISAAIHDSTMDELSLVIRQKIDLEMYKKSLEKECDEYDSLLEKSEKDLERALKKVEQPLAEDGCPEARARADGRKARNVVQKVMKLFRTHNEHSHLKHENENLRKEIADMQDSLENETSACERLLLLLNGESLEDLLGHNEYLSRRIEKITNRQKECMELFGDLIPVL